MNRSDLTERLREKATQLGFCSVGFCPAAEPAGFGRLQAWLDAGYAGQLHYMVDRRDAYRHPRHVLDGARSLVVLGTDYRNLEPEVARKTRGRISRYAWGADYHEVIRRRLRALADYHRELTPQAAVRGVVDTAPLLEREAAVLAGLGWIGKNTLLLTGESRQLAVPLRSPDRASSLSTASHASRDRAGRAERVSTPARPAPWLDPACSARKVASSYLTVELQGSVPRELRPRIGPLVVRVRCLPGSLPLESPVAHAAGGLSARPGFFGRRGMASIELARGVCPERHRFRSRFSANGL